jgi:hypothetical protein
MTVSRADNVTRREDAERLVAGVLDTMADLRSVLESEAAHIRIGQFRDGLAAEARKSELAGAYLKGLETIKANAVAIARLVPELIPTFREAQANFHRTVETNQAVLATARAVSESLVKSIAEELGRRTKPLAYAPAGVAPRRQRSSEPLVLSKTF